MEVWLFVVKVHFSAIGLFSWQVVGKDFGFEALGELIFEFNFGIE